MIYMMFAVYYYAFALTGRGIPGYTRIPRVPLRSALGYEQVALSGRPSLERDLAMGQEGLVTGTSDSQDERI